MSPAKDVAFDFGENWRDFSDSALTPERVEQARNDFCELLSGIELKGRSFLDIGFGQGLGLLAASAMEARPAGCDINPTCAEVLAANQKRTGGGSAVPIPVVVGSILDPDVVNEVRAMGDADGHFDVVHSWGVLHHTGDMRTAISNAGGLVGESGHFVLAIYNRHWSSPLWWVIKRVYNACPRLLQKMMIAVFFPVIFLAKLIVTRCNPLRKDRGMDFFYDVVDWVGGYPYEYASVVEVEQLVHPMGFVTVKVRPAEVPTGCNEFVFRKKKLAR